MSAPCSPNSADEAIEMKYIRDMVELHKGMMDLTIRLQELTKFVILLKVDLERRLRILEAENG